MTMDQRQIFLKERVKAAVDRKRMPKSRRARKGKYYHIPHHGCQCIDMAETIIFCIFTNKGIVILLK